jgi:hypothetical protein
MVISVKVDASCYCCVAMRVKWDNLVYCVRGIRDRVWEIQKLGVWLVAI